ncbi:hypothetical protein, partial [Brevibacillus sp. CF112]
WFKAGKSFNDRLINAFAVQFSKSIFHSPLKATFLVYHAVQAFARCFLKLLFAQQRQFNTLSDKNPEVNTFIFLFDVCFN